MDYNACLIDIPTGKTDCRPLFNRLMKKAPTNVKAKVHARGQNHTGNGTSWSGAYDTYEIYDPRRPDWPTEEVEQWTGKISWEITSYLNQQREMKIR